MLTNLLTQLKQVWSRWNSKQRTGAVISGLVTLLALGLALRTLSTPEYKPLMVGMEPADVQTVSAALAARKIPFELTPDGKGINVAADQLDAARIEVASQAESHSGRMGFELFDKSSWGQTEFDEKVNYQRALEGELERTIGTMNNIRSARVHLVMPTASVFLDRERTAKASVTLRMKRGPLATDQLNAIARLVSGAVDNLAPHDVTIVDADSNESLGGKSNGLEGRELEAELARRLVATLGPAVGAENLRASVNVEYDSSSSETSEDKYDPAVSAVLTSQKSQEQTGSGLSVGGVAGTAANLPNTGSTPPSTTADDSSQTSSSDNSTFGVNKIVRHTVLPAGRIHKLSAAILVNDIVEHKQVKGKWVNTSHKRTQAQLDQLAELARGVLGADKDRGDLVTVQNMTFHDEDNVASAPTFLENVRSRLSEASTPLRYAAIVSLFLLVWALMFRPLQKQIEASLKELPGGRAPGTAALQATSQADLPSLATVSALEADSDVASLKQEIHDLVLAEPAAMTRSLQGWLREPQG